MQKFVSKKQLTGSVKTTRSSRQNSQRLLSCCTDFQPYIFCVFQVFSVNQASLPNIQVFLFKFFRITQNSSQRKPVIIANTLPQRFSKLKTIQAPQLYGMLFFIHGIHFEFSLSISNACTLDQFLHSRTYALNVSTTILHEEHFKSL